ncbi:MAG: aminoacyl-tRNA hydrolase [Candidatus Omnitrophica bacterium]|nr:aminoacyl-tRNA hydrolase [Candidatus Omnitrophota bacterium]
MKLIVGLGNPGTKYINTRHNVGFRVVDELAQRHNTKLKKKLFGNAKEAQFKKYGEKCILIQPYTFMNLSGSCIRGYIRKLDITLDNILVICDDINLPLGTARIRPDGSAGGHNGLESAIKGLGGSVFPRLRVGIKPEAEIDDLSDYVLSDFESDEIGIVKESIVEAADACECWIRDGIDKAMNVYNR